MRLHAAITATLITAAIVTTPVARAACDISQTKCALNDGNCNIKFLNHTGLGTGSAHRTDLHQKASAQVIKIKAIEDDGGTAGNSLKIQAGASKTMNIDKKAKKDFAKIRITSPTMARVENVTMGCADVQAVLNGNGRCKVFHGQKSIEVTNFQFQLGYDCDNGNVSGPAKE